jgi:hypothetical protein
VNDFCRRRHRTGQHYRPERFDLATVDHSFSITCRHSGRQISHLLL